MQFQFLCTSMYFFFRLHHFLCSKLMPHGGKMRKGFNLPSVFYWCKKRFLKAVDIILPLNYVADHCVLMQNRDILLTLKMKIFTLLRTVENSIYSQVLSFKDQWVFHWELFHSAHKTCQTCLSCNRTCYKTGSCQAHKAFHLVSVLLHREHAVEGKT